MSKITSDGVQLFGSSTTLRVRIVQRLLVSQDFTFVLSSITWMYTQFWLIQQGRFADLAEYLQTEDMRFVEEANLIIDDLASNSPALITLITDPHFDTTVVTTTVTLVVALQKAIDAVAQTWNKHKSNELEHQKEQLKLKRMQWEFEQEQSKKQQEMRNKEIEDALNIVKKIAEGLNPGADEQARITMDQAMLPIWEKFLALK